jgi:hypothetical protein
MKMKFYGVFLVIFASGLTIGYFLGQYVDRIRMHHLMQQGSQRIEAMISDRLIHHLDLDTTQAQAVRAKVEVVIVQAESEFRRQGDMMRSRMTNLLAEIRPILTVSQQAILDRMDADDLRPGPPPGEGRGDRSLPPLPQGSHPGARER